MGEGEIDGEMDTSLEVGKVDCVVLSIEGNSESRNDSVALVVVSPVELICPTSSRHRAAEVFLAILGPISERRTGRKRGFETRLTRKHL